MYGLFGFAENVNFTDMFNIQDCANSTGNCVNQSYRLTGFAKNLNFVNTLNVQNCANSTRNWVH